MPKSNMILPKKAPAATLTTRNRVFYKKKAPAATLTTKTMVFYQKKAPAATFTTQKMIFVAPISVQIARIFNISRSIMPKSGMILLYMGAIMPLLSYSLPDCRIRWHD